MSEARFEEPPVRLGLVGAGRAAGRLHLPAIDRAPGLRLVALADPDRGAREEAARGRDVAALAEVEDLLAREDVEAVLIASPSGTHAELAVRVLEAGKHVYVEKPVAIDAEQAVAVLEAWRGSGLVGACGLQLRGDPRVRDLRARIARGDIGPVTTASSEFWSRPRRLPGWKASRESGGGALLDLGSHHLDLLPYALADPIRSVFARIDSRRSEADTATLLLELDSGICATARFSLVAVERDRLEVAGERGALVVDRYFRRDVRRARVGRPRNRRERLTHAAGTALDAANAVRDAVLAPADAALVGALGGFAVAVRTGGRPIADLADGVRSLAAVLAAEESSRSGSPEPVVDPVPGAVAERSEEPGRA